MCHVWKYSFVINNTDPLCPLIFFFVIFFPAREHAAGGPAGPVAAGARVYAAGLPVCGPWCTQRPERDLPGEGAEAPSGAAGVPAAQWCLEGQVYVTDQLWVLGRNCRPDGASAIPHQGINLKRKSGVRKEGQKGTSHYLDLTVTQSTCCSNSLPHKRETNVPYSH